MLQNTMRRGLTFAAVMLAGAFVSSALAQQQQAASWSTAAPLPMPRSEMKAVTANGKIYLIGGSWTEMKDGQDVDNYTTGFTTEYDPQTNRFRERAKGPEGLTHQALAVLNGKIYAAGGFAASRHTMSSGNVYAYDPATDRWETLPPLSEKRGGGTLAAVGGMLHAIGGRVMGEDVLATHEVYNPATRTWRRVAPMPTPRDHVASFVVDGKIHVIGGRVGETEANVANHDIYDPATDRWTSAPPMPTPRSSLAYAEYRGLLVVAGGECRDRMAYNEVEAFDTRNNRWVTLPDLPQPRHGFAAAVAADKLFFFGGSTRCGGGGKTAETVILTLR